MDRNSKISIAGQSREEAGPAKIQDKRPRISHSQSQEDLPTRKLLGSKKGSDAKLPVVLFPGIHLG